MNPRTKSITHIDIKSQPERHTISRAELASIVVALKQENTEGNMNILIDTSFCMNAIRNYIVGPAAYNHHLHKDLLQHINQLLIDRDSKQLKTNTGKDKSHTDVEYNETADKVARAVVDGKNTPDITFEDADPPIGGLRTWPHDKTQPS